MMDRMSKVLILANSANVSLLAFGNLPLIPALLVTVPIGALLIYMFAIDLDKKSTDDDSEATSSSQNYVENDKIEHEQTITLNEIFGHEEDSTSLDKEYQNEMQYVEIGRKNVRK